MITYIMGPSCAGKSTEAKRRQKQGEIILDFDALAQALGSPSSHEHPPSILEAVHPARVMIENRAISGELSSRVWAIRSWLPEKRIKALGKQGARFILLDPGEEVALARAAEDGRPEGTAENIRRWYENPPVIPDEYLFEEEKGASLIFKNFDFESKEAPDGAEAEEGIFTGYASIFNNIDSYGDMVRPGAFTDSLKSFGEGGAGIPCYWGHQMDDPMKCIGWTTAAEEDERGLKVTVQLDISNPNGAQAYHLIKKGLVNQMSFAYEVEEGAWVEAKDTSAGGYCELRKLKIFEVSLVQVGANQETQLLDVKAHLSKLKAGRKISASNQEKLTQALKLISSVLGDEDDFQDEGSSEELEEGKAEERESAKAEDPTPAKARTLSPVEIAQYELDLL